MQVLLLPDLQPPRLPTAIGGEPEFLGTAVDNGNGFVINAFDKTSGRVSTLNLGQKIQMTSAFVALSVFNVAGCIDYPTVASFVFNSLQYSSASGQLSPSWAATVAVDDGCRENVVVQSPSQVSLYWSTSG